MFKNLLKESEIGSKAFNLHRLRMFGAAVPEWFCIPASVFHSFLISVGLPKISAILQVCDAKKPASFSQASRRIRSIIQRKPLSGKFERKLLVMYHELRKKSGVAELSVAVRSSAIGEDSNGKSFAGMYDSFLFVHPENLPKSVKLCWASAFSERALAYRAAVGLPLDKVSMAVIVQQMVPAESAGVLFTNVGGSLLIHAAHGVGVQLLQGKAKPYEYVFTRSNLACLKRPSGNVPLEMPVAARLAAIALKIERKFGIPLDLEWAFAGSMLFLLQARPIASGKNEVIWDNSNIIESYSGVTSPLTFSVASEAYYLVYRQFCEVLGVPKKEVQMNDEIFRNMIGYIQGRVYYNLKSWYGLLALLPGLGHSPRFMENMMGVKQQLDMQHMPKSGIRTATDSIALLVRIIYHWLTISRHARVFHANFKQVYGEYRGVNFNSYNEQRLIEAFLDIKMRLIANWKAPIINDFLAMAAFGLLRKATVAWCSDPSGSLYNLLLSGRGSVESALLPKYLDKMAFLVSSSRKYRRLFKMDAAVVVKKIMSGMDYKEMLPLWGEFLERFGDRSFGELKLEQSCYRDNPASLVGIIRSYAGRSRANDNAAAKARFDVEKEMRRRIARKPIIYQAVFWALVNRAQVYASNRENMRLCRTRAYGLLRSIFNALGQRLYQRDLLSHPGDIFFLTLNEITGFVNGTAYTLNLKQLVAIRKREQRGFVKVSLPNRFVTNGIVYCNALSPQSSAPVLEILRGIGCSPGIVVGRVKVVKPPLDKVKLNSEILVAESTDPGWVVLYPLCKGILIERGSALSHSAIVARELGIPAIVGIAGLSQSLKTGDTVRMNGASGTVELIK